VSVVRIIAAKLNLELTMAASIAQINNNIRFNVIMKLSRSPSAKKFRTLQSQHNSCTNCSTCNDSSISIWITPCMQCFLIIEDHYDARFLTLWHFCCCPMLDLMSCCIEKSYSHGLFLLQTTYPPFWIVMINDHVKGVISIFWPLNVSTCNRFLLYVMFCS